ncbi:large subunit ribosomal protein L13Ae [Enteropsectra breve]|nr:large subunit ribosomal protein L13Ae [Enteropsectra breve]
MQKDLIIDGTDHVAGKLSAFIAKKLLEGYSITVLCTENIKFTGPLHRQIGKYRSFKDKRCLYNPERGPFHWREPSKYFTKIVRGMLPRKTVRGTEAFNRMTCYEGIPKQFEGVDRVKVPQSLIQVTADCNRESCTLGQILSYYGWAHAPLTKSLTEGLRAREAEARKSESEKADSVQQMVENSAFKSEVQKRMEQFA